MPSPTILETVGSATAAAVGELVIGKLVMR
jgi:hypothetical protein